MISVAEAVETIRRALSPLDAEEVAIEGAAGRTLAAPVVAALSQPPFAASAMDGYAVRFAEAHAEGARLSLAGVSSAGERFAGPLPAGAAVRIFTGAPVPEGADHVLIQEEARAEDDEIVVAKAQAKPGNIRAAGIDFSEGERLLEKGARLTGPALALAAAAGAARLRVARRPRVALIANGDELVLPGKAREPDQIICSIPYGLAPMIEGWGAEAVFLGVAPDDKGAIRRLVEQAADCDLVVPIGGASVGERDFMRAVFADLGFRPLFEKVAVKPGKPTWFAPGKSAAALGLPGNPASALVMAILFLRPAIARLLGRREDEAIIRARTETALPANGARETYLRARLIEGEDGARRVAAFENQDSSLLSVFARADILIRRPAGTPPAPAGALVECVTI